VGGVVSSQGMRESLKKNEEGRYHEKDSGSSKGKKKLAIETLRKKRGKRTPLIK